MKKFLFFTLPVEYGVAVDELLHAERDLLASSYAHLGLHRSSGYEGPTGSAHALHSDRDEGR